MRIWYTGPLGISTERCMDLLPLIPWVPSISRIRVCEIHLKRRAIVKLNRNEYTQGTLFRNNLKHINNLFQMTSHGVRPLLKGMHWTKCYKQGATVTVQHGDTYHAVS